MKTVLVAEDNPANMKLCRLLLESAGHGVLQAVDGGAALQLAREASPDLILMDVQMPGMSGLEVLAALRADTMTAAIPVVAVTALAMRGDESSLREAGFDDYIEKPYHTTDFLNRIAARLAAGVRT